MLRFVIGWHFAYEGISKVESWRKNDKPFSAEGYLRNSTGPFAPYFRGIVPDVDGLAKLDPTRLKAAWKDDVERIGAHFGFNDDQRSKATALLADSDTFIDEWFRDRENREKVAKYRHDLEAVEKVERNPLAMTNQKVWAAGERKTLDTERKALLKELDARGASLREAASKLAPPEQAASAGPYTPPLTSLDINNYLTAFGLIAIGGCLMAGLFTRPAALGGVLFLTLVYLASPPWPGLPDNPTDPGHYRFIDKTVVEAAALLALSALPTGHWIGLDALLFGWLRRKREAAREDRAERRHEYAGR